MARKAQVRGIGGYVPDKVLSNADLAEIMDTSDEWIVSRSGIHQRHQAEDVKKSFARCLPARQGRPFLGRIAAGDAEDQSKQPNRRPKYRYGCRRCKGQSRVDPVAEHTTDADRSDAFAEHRLRLPPATQPHQNLARKYL